ncbi:ABC transporter substrate-binding protein [Bradyrhizobium sp. CB1650]|uniref:ABC transporter substrate-binding protein n=1 Tax=Bradyrhizobium sp. CB1650 TaxID=3039153 RepID=UPI0024353246|nr:ABC transporter substrate-binding protein [Bradyrhizobium sp. CB1650]WGD51010.1 ABC transporter substrate-binding protein [Bradyrhizobium sp. CB1650]
MITRRNFTGLIGAAALSTASRPSMAQQTAPRRGGRVRVMLQETASSSLLDPTKVASWAVYFAYELIGARLVNVDSHLQPIPALAESWEAANGKVNDWIFRLRRGAEFHDGRSVTARDVIYTINRLRDPAAQSPLRVLVDHVSDIVAEDPQTIRFKLTRPDADFPLLLAQDRFHILPEGYSRFDKPLGAGAFIANGLDPAGVNTYRRNPNFWDGDKPYLDEVSFQGNQDPIARVSALLAGDVDAVQTISFALAKRVAAVTGLEVVSSPSGVHNVVAMHVDKAPFDHVEVREALKCLFDRSLLRDKLCAGQASIANDHPIPPFSPFYHSELPVRPYDPDRARTLLRQAGVDLGQLVLHASEAVTPNVAVDLAQMFADTARQAGVNVQARRDPVAGYWDNIWLKEPLMVGGWGTRYTPDAMLRVAYRSDAKWNETRWRRPEIDRMMDDALATTDLERRRLLYWGIQEAIHKEGGAAIPLFFNQLDAKASYVKGVAPSPLGALKGSAFSEIWLDREI